MNNYRKTDETFLHSNKRCYKIYLKNKNKYIRKKNKEKGTIEYVCVSSLQTKKPKKGGNITNYEIEKRQRNYANNFPAPHINEINDYYINQIDIHITLLTKLFILFIFYIRDLQDNRQYTVEKMKESLDWIIEDLTTEDIYVQNYERFSKILNIPFLLYKNETLQIICVSEYAYTNGEYKEEQVVDRSDIPSEMYLGVNHLYKKEQTPDHAVYASFENDENIIYIYDINCLDSKRKEEQQIQTYFQNLKTKFGIIVKYISSNILIGKDKHSILLDDLDTLMKEHYPSKKREVPGICTYLSMFQYFLLSYESPENKLGIHEMLNHLAKTRVNVNAEIKKTANTSFFKRFFKQNTKQVTQVTPAIQNTLDEIRYLLRGTPNKANFIQIVNKLRQNDYIIQQTSGKEPPILELNCNNEENLMNIEQEKKYTVADIEHYNCTKMIKPCINKDIPLEIIKYILTKFLIQTQDQLLNKSYNKNDDFFIVYYILFYSVFTVKKSINETVEITLKIDKSPNEYIVGRIKYKSSNEKDIRKQNQMKLNNYLTNYVASFLIGNIIRNDKEYIRHQIASKNLTKLDEKNEPFVKKYFQSYVSQQTNKKSIKNPQKT